tara:strand:+ start:110 stop:352 length:243 start_codon:yes stop_codon:yes gene_type:complete
VSDLLSNGQPFDPIGEAMKNLERINELAAAQARIKQLEERNEAMREAGDEIWYVLRHAPEVTPEDIMHACSEWADKRRHG